MTFLLAITLFFGCIWLLGAIFTGSIQGGTNAAGSAFGVIFEVVQGYILSAVIVIVGGLVAAICGPNFNKIMIWLAFGAAAFAFYLPIYQELKRKESSDARIAVLTILATITPSTLLFVMAAPKTNNLIDYLPADGQLLPFPIAIVGIIAYGIAITYWKPPEGQSVAVSSRDGHIATTNPTTVSSFMTTNARIPQGIAPELVKRIGRDRTALVPIEFRKEFSRCTVQEIENLVQVTGDAILKGIHSERLVRGLVKSGWSLDVSEWYVNRAYVDGSSFWPEFD